MGFVKEFREFVSRGNVMDMAVGIIIGGAFSAIVSSLVDDIINPVVGIFSGKDFSQLFVSLNGEEYASLTAAEEAGASVLKYGAFISAIINFIIIALVIFLIIKVINNMRRKMEKPAEDAPPTTKVCEFCKSEIPIEATRCPQCTSVLPEAAPAEADV